MIFILIPICLIISIFVSCTFIVHNRGKVQLSWKQQLTDHSTFTSPINVLMFLTSKLKNEPIIEQHLFPELTVLQDNWQLILKEAKSLQHDESIVTKTEFDDIGFNSFFETGWKRFYIKWYGDFHRSAMSRCPGTINLLRSLPRIKAAAFVILPAGSVLAPHRDWYALSFRYHLAIETPNHSECCITIDGETYTWKDGEGILFDPTYIHHAKNKTGSDRLILFCDIERPMKNKFFQFINNLFSKILASPARSPNDASDKPGITNRITGFLYRNFLKKNSE